MRVLGIDPGYAIVGWGVVEYIGNRFTPVDFGAVCVGCEVYLKCRARWMETADPVFKGAGVFPTLFRKD